MFSARIARRVASISLGALAAATVVLGAAVPAAAATPNQPEQSSSTLTAPDHPYRPKPGAEFRRLINEARAHPELYPPHGNTAGAKMTGCSNPLGYSTKLQHIAAEHNRYLASQPLDWLSAKDENGKSKMNAHRNPNGKLVWDAGEPMDQAGYHSRRAEIVAWGYPTKEEALRAWMQDDEASNWGHRNIILDCALQWAGPSTVHSNNVAYYTVDMGNP